MPRSGAPPSTATPWVELALGGRRWSGQLDQAGTEAVALAPLLPELSPRDRVTLRGADLRRDLPSLVNALRRRDLGMRSDGATPASALARLGFQRLRLELCSAKPEAHDWLVGRTGSWRQLIKTARSVPASMSLEVEVPITRPTALHLDDTVALAARLGAQSLWLRRLRGDAPDFLSLSPRLGLTQAALERAVRNGRHLGMTVHVRDFPACALGGVADALTQVRVLGEPAIEHVPGCAQCTCPGVAKAYVQTFGWREVRSQDGPPSPAVLGARVHEPSTRPAHAQAVARENPAPPASQGPAVLTVVLPTQGPTRPLRQLLNEAAQRRPQRLRVVSQGHAQTLDLLRDACRLGVAQVDGLVPPGCLPADDRALARLSPLRQLEVVLAAPEAGALDLVRRLTRLRDTKRFPTVGVVVVVDAVLQHIWPDLLPDLPPWRAVLAPSGDYADLDLDNPVVQALQLPACLGGAAPSPAPAPYDPARATAPALTDTGPSCAPCPAERACSGPAIGWTLTGCP
jgi:hypothetical protein